MNINVTNMANVNDMAESKPSDGHHGAVPGVGNLNTDEDESCSDHSAEAGNINLKVDGSAAEVGVRAGEYAAAAGPVADSNDEELDYAMAMMNAMEDGLSEEEDDDGTENDVVPGPNEVPVANAQPEDTNDDEENISRQQEILSEKELEYARAMMHAMEDGQNYEEYQDALDGSENDAEEFDYGMGMMQAMEDGSEEEEEDGEDYQEAREQAFATRHLGNTTAEESTSGIANLGSNILQVCSSLNQAVREYYRMSQTDQLQVWDDLTGFQGQKRTFVEGKELPGYKEEYEPRHIVEAALQQLPLELERMPSSHPHEGLDMALEIAPGYVNDRLFLLKFLRAEKLDVFATASRICRHFEAKLELFGKEKLGRDITLDDLNEDDMAAFKSGYIQVLEEEDQSHRPVLFYYKAVSSECYKNRENILRAFFYMGTRLGEQEEIQKVGVSNVVYNNGGFPRQGMDYEKSRRMAHLFRSIPVRFNNFYVCLDDMPWLTAVETFAVLITRFLRVRLRMIRGTHEEVVEKLMAVGLPARALPVTSNSELIVGPHLKWIEKQRIAEEKSKQLKKATGDALSSTNPSGTSSDNAFRVEMDMLAQLTMYRDPLMQGNPHKRSAS